MMGTSLLAMPWALQQAGLVLGVLLMAAMAFLALYTAYRVVESPLGLSEFRKRRSDLFQHLTWSRAQPSFRTFAGISGARRANTRPFSSPSWSCSAE